MACTRTISEFALIVRGSCESPLGATLDELDPAVPAAAAADIFLGDCAAALLRPSGASPSVSPVSADDAVSVSEPESDSVCTTCAAAC